MARVILRYGSHSVEVVAGEERVLRRVRASFRQMLSEAASESADVLTVGRAESHYELRRGETSILTAAELLEVQKSLRHEIIRSFVSAHPDFLWLHSGAAARNGRGLLLVGRYGRGKSTLVTMLCHRGWHYLSDDVTPIDLQAGRAHPFPLTPIVREPVAEELPQERMGELRRWRVSLPRTSFARESVPVAGIVIPAFRTGAGVALRSFSPAALALDMVREGLNREDHGAQSVATFARLVSDVPVVALDFSDPAAAVDLIESQLRSHPLWRDGFDTVTASDPEPPPDQKASTIPLGPP
jgi:hypothetical protein